MEDAELPQDTSANTPFNEVSIIPSKSQLNDGANDSSIQASKGAVSGVSSEAVIVPSSTALQKQGNRYASKPRPKHSLGSASLSSASLSFSSRDGCTALEAQIREHLIDRLMPQSEKGPVTRLNVELPEELHQQLKQHCVRARTPIKGLINALIAWYFEAEEIA